MNVALDQVAEIIHRESGIVLKPGQQSALGAAIDRAAPRMDPLGFLSLLDDPVGGPAALQRLIDEVTVKETSFFRDPGQLRPINWPSLLDGARVAGRDTIRVWTAGCATGEEAYTLAILACEAYGSPEPPVSILATDISVAALRAALEGRYRLRAVRTVDPALRDRYFRIDDQRFVVSGGLRNLVTFGRHNLVRDPVPPLGEARFDLIVCRNVLIYFDGDTVERTIGTFEQRRPTGRNAPARGDRRALRYHAASWTSDRPGLGPIRPWLPPARPPCARSADKRNARAEEPILDPDAYFLRGVAELEAGDAAAAITSLRRALYLDPMFCLAAFQLGRAHDTVGDETAARRAYEQVLRTLQPEDDRHEALIAQIDVSDIAAACRARIMALTASG